jgi:DNA adenine methylase
VPSHHREQFPPHDTYVKPFGGAASVLLNKVLSPVEVYNDLDQRITRLFRVLRDHGPELQRRLSLTPYSELEFEEADKDVGDEIEQAASCSATKAAERRRGEWRKPAAN